MNEATKRHMEREHNENADRAKLAAAQDERDEQRRDANRIARDLTACRSELASIALLMQDRGQLPDPGGANFALVGGAVMTYVLALELGVVALNQDRQQLLEQIGGLNNLLACEAVIDDIARHFHKRDEQR